MRVARSLSRCPVPPLDSPDFVEIQRMFDWKTWTWKTWKVWTVIGIGGAIALDWGYTTLWYPAWVPIGSSGTKVGIFVALESPPTPATLTIDIPDTAFPGNSTYLFTNSLNNASDLPSVSYLDCKAKTNASPAALSEPGLSGLRQIKATRYAHNWMQPKISPSDLRFRSRI